MPRFLSLLVLALSMTQPAAAQDLPAGEAIQSSTVGAPNSVTADFDGDGKADRFSVLGSESSQEDSRLHVRMATGSVLRSGVFSACCSEVAVKGLVVKLTSTGMRFFTHYTFRYEKAAGDFRLIGYDTESFGNAMNDGAGTSSLNLLTGNFSAAYQSYSARQQKVVTLPKVQKKLVLRRSYYLRDFGDAADEQLANLVHDNNPKEVR